MAKLDVDSAPKSAGSYEAVVTNLGPETVILSRIEGKGGADSFFSSPPLHRSDLELVRGGRHRFAVTPALSDGNVIEVDITFTDETGERTKTYPVYI
jgi:hypothetical protein